jgi:hypothetical protein
MTDPDRLAEIKARMAEHAYPAEARERYFRIHGAMDLGWLVGEVERLRDEIAIAMRLADEEATEGRRLHALLARLEWASSISVSGGPQCPACGALKEAGPHLPGCEWVAVIHPEREEVPPPK